MSPPNVDLDALLCALVLAPRAYARNRFFGLFEDPQARRVRRRAARIRGIVRQLAGEGKLRAEILGEQLLEDGRWLVRYEMAHLGLVRTAALSSLEAAVLRYALSRAGKAEVGTADRARVLEALTGLAPELARAALGSDAERTSGAPSSDAPPST